MKKVKKVDVKMVAKLALSEVLVEAVKAAGFEVKSGEDFGLAKGAFVVSMDEVDVKVTLVAPKAGVSRYEVAVDEAEAEVAAE